MVAIEIFSIEPSVPQGSTWIGFEKILWQAAQDMLDMTT